MVRSLGADHVIDYTQEDFTQSGERYNRIFDISGNHPFSACRRVLTPEGTYVLIGHDRFGQGVGRWFGSIPRVLKLVALSPFVSQIPTPNFSMPDKKNQMVVLKELLEAGKITPVIDRTYSLSEVPEAIRYLEEGHAQGKVVITV
jgi:NADPH:quinone reductase-like Zn-dependent oxidoreductase